MKPSLYNNESEKIILGGFINDPNLFIDHAHLINREDFNVELHQTIMSIIQRAYCNREKLDAVIIAERVNALGVECGDAKLKTYLPQIMRNKPDSKLMRQHITSVKNLSVRRQLTQTLERARDNIETNLDGSIDNVVSYIQRELNRKIDTFYEDDDTFNLFEGLYDLLIKRGREPLANTGLESHFKSFNKWYGGFKVGDVYVFCARPGNNKTTLLNNLGFHLGNKGQEKVPVLIIDTEMGQEDEFGEQAIDVKMRLAASLLDTNPNILTTGKWAQNEELARRIMSKKFRDDLSSYKLDYKFLPNSNTQNLTSTIKRWYYSKVGMGKKCVIIYDYIKFSAGDGLGSSNEKEYQIIGEKVDALKSLVGKEVKASLLTAVQLNRSGSTYAKGRSDDDTAIAISDRIMWFATFCGIFRKKDEQEYSEEGGYENGTHKLIKTKARFLGEEIPPDIIKNHKGETKINFLNFKVKNFNVDEIGTAEEMYAKLDASPKEDENYDKKISNYDQDRNSKFC